MGVTRGQYNLSSATYIRLLYTLQGFYNQARALEPNQKLSFVTHSPRLHVGKHLTAYKGGASSHANSYITKHKYPQVATRRGLSEATGSTSQGEYDVLSDLATVARRHSR